MKKPFDNEYPITQQYNDICCRASYAKFGMKGHNGLDFGCPTGTKILAPHDGKIIEATLDPQGYGIYLKIENSIEGSVLAHLREYRVGVGDGVKEGDLVGYSDNSGNSTGSHLHWGYYRFPRDRQNGFAGFIDQTQYIGQQNTIPDLQGQLNVCIANRDSHWDDRINIAKKLNVENNMTVILGEIEKLIGYEDGVIQKDRQLQEANTKITDLEMQFKDLSIKHESMRIENATLIVEVKEQGETIQKEAEIRKNLQSELQTLKDGLQKPIRTGLAKIIDGFFELIGRR